MNAALFVGWRRLVLAAGLAGITVVALAGITRLTFNDDYRLVFRSHAEDFRRLEEVFDQFGADEADLVVILEADDVTTPGRLAALDAFEARLGELDDVAEVFSILSVPDPAAPARALFLAGVPESPELRAARDAARRHPLARGMLSDDRATTAVLVQLAVDLADTAAMRDALVEVRAAAEQTLLPFDRRRITGVPAIRQAVRDNALHSQQRYALMAGVLATLISALLFRSPGIMLTVGIGPLLAVLWTLGLLGWIDHQINLVNHLIIELVMVISFTDAVHLAFHVRRRRRLGDPPAAAAASAVKSLWFPCMLTSLTTAIGFGSLVFAELDIVRKFGAACAAGTALGFVAVILSTPLISTLFPAAFARRPPPRRHSPPQLGPLIERHARLIVATGLVLLVACLWLGLGLRADYRYRDFAPAQHEAVTAMTAADRALGGAVPLRVVVQWPADRDLSDPEVIDFLGAVQATVAAAPLSGATMSILDVVGTSPGLPTQDRLRFVPAGLARRLLRDDLHRALVSSHWPDVGAAQQLPELDELTRRLTELSSAHHGFEATPAGVLVMSAHASTQTIHDLARSLTIATSLILVVLLAAFRSLRLATIGMLANVVPLAGAAALLGVAGQPLEYSTVLVFTICIGLAVDDTIHFLADYRTRVGDEGPSPAAVRATLHELAPVLTITTVILIAGFGTLLTSAVPSEVRMGALSCAALLLALLGDLVLLPAMLFTVIGLRGQSDAAAAAPASPTGLAPRRDAPNGGKALLILLPAVALHGCSVNRLATDYTNQLAGRAAAVLADESDWEMARISAFSLTGNLEALARMNPDDAAIAVSAAAQYANIASAFLELDVLRADGLDEERAAAARAREMYGRGLRHAARALTLEGIANAATLSADDWAAVLARRAGEIGAGAGGEGNQFTRSALLFAYNLAGSLRMDGVLSPGHDAAGDLARLGSILEALVQNGESVDFAAPLLLSASFHAAAPLHRGGDLVQAHAEFERVIELTDGRLLIAQVLYAELYCTEQGDRTCFDALLTEVDAAPLDVLAGHRLLTVAAKLRAAALQARIDTLFGDGP